MKINLPPPAVTDPHLKELREEREFYTAEIKADREEIVATRAFHAEQIAKMEKRLARLEHEQAIVEREIEAVTSRRR